MANSKAEIQALDIETIPGAKFMEADPPESFLNRGIKDNFKPDTVQRYREDNYSKWVDEAPKAGALDWRTCEVVAIGIARPHGVMVSLPVRLPPDYTVVEEIAGVPIIVTTGDGEAAVIRNGVGLLAPSLPVHGFGLSTFDWPVLRLRSAALGIKGLQMDRWRYRRWDQGNGSLVDWQDLLSSQGRFEMKGWSLDHYAEFFGLEVQARPTENTIWNAYQAGDWAYIVEHVARDVLCTYQLADRFKEAL